MNKPTITATSAKRGQVTSASGAAGGQASRPRPPAMLPVTMRLPRQLVDDLKRLAEAKHCKYQKLARTALSSFVAASKKA